MTIAFLVIVGSGALICVWRCVYDAIIGPRLTRDRLLDIIERRNQDRLGS
ncbi:MAG: hypothetical protein IT537_08195 [Hyphomicrobiales bacterium]|nr:hypothetical protein [Hyphomicrobiales bacterium]